MLMLPMLSIGTNSFRKQFHNATTQFIMPKNDDHGICLGNMEELLAQRWHPVASMVALDLPCWNMRSESHRHIAMAIKMAPNGGTLVR
jgi:hypothetical protein